MKLGEVLELSYHFVITCIVLVGGGFMLYNGHSTETVVGALMMVLTFWFTNNQKRAANKNQDSAGSTPDTTTLKTPDQLVKQNATPAGAFDVIQK